MPIQNLVSSEKNNITVADFIGDKDRLFFDVATRTFRLSDGVTPGGIVVNTGGGGGGSYTDFSVDLHLNRATASSGEILSWSGTDYAWIAPGIQTSDLSLTTNSANGGGALTYNNGTGAFAFTPPDLSGFATTGSVSLKIGLSDLSVGTEGSASGDGALAYNDATGVFTYTPPDLSSLATAASVASKIELTDLSVGAEGIAQGDGAIEYNNATGVFKYTPPVIPSTLLILGISDGSNGQVLQTDGAGNFSFVNQTGGGGGGSQNVFDKIAVAGENNVVADSTTDTLTFVAGSNMTITTNATTDTITFASTGGSGTTVNPEFTESITLDSDESTDAVSTEFVIFYGSTTNATTTTLYRNSSNASISIAQQTTVFFEADVIGRDDGTPDYGAFKIKGIIDNDSSGNTQLISSQKEIIHAGANNLFDANIVADNTNDVLSVEVNGENSKNIRWSALVKVVIVKQT